MSHPNQLSNHPGEQQGQDMEYARQSWMDGVEPILDQMDDVNLKYLDDLNYQTEAAYADALHDTRNERYDDYIAQGMSDAEALDRVEQETSTREFERSLQRSVIEAQKQEIDDLLPNFTYNLDPMDPDYTQKEDDIREALVQVASIPRNEWEGDQDEHGDPRENGFYDALRDTFESDDANAPEPVTAVPDAGRAVGRAQVHYNNTHAQGRARVQNNHAAHQNPQQAQTHPQPGPNPNHPHPNPNQHPQQTPNHQTQPHNANRLNPQYIDRLSVANERYGAKVGDTFVFRQTHPNGVQVLIHYEIVGFPAKLPNEPLPPVTLRRSQSQYSPQGLLLGAPMVSQYHLSTDHLKHLGKDTKTFKKSNNEPMDLGEYWKTVGSRERWKKVRKTGYKVLGAAALVGIGIEVGRKGGDIGAAMDSVKDLFGLGGHEVVDTATGTDIGNALLNNSTNPSNLTPEQAHLAEILANPVKDNLGGIELYNNLGLDSQTWYDQQQTLLDKFPGDFSIIDHGRHAGEIGLRHPGKPLSPQAAAYIAQQNGLWQ